MKTILFFTAGINPTEDEAAQIAALNASVAFKIQVRNGQQSSQFGAGPEVADFLAGTIPAEYLDEDEEPIYPVLAEGRAPSLTDTQAVVSNAQVINITGGGTVALTVAGGEITGAVYTAP